MGKCCGASKSQKNAERSRGRQEDLEDIVIDSPRPSEPIGRSSAPDLSLARIQPVDVSPPRPKASDMVKGWKRERQERVTDRYGEMVFEKDIGGIGGVSMQGGKVPTVDGDMSSRGQPFSTFSQPDQDMVGVAQETLQEVRSSLPLGAFNNHVGLPRAVKRRQNKPGTNDHAPGWWNSVVDIAAGMAAEQLGPTMPGVNAHKLQLACLARATKAVGGGVCSKMATMTTGILTTTLPPGSEIAQVYSNYDHEFVIARTPGSRWFVVDPWPEQPLTVPFVDCSFSPDSITKFIITNVTETAPKGLPFGIDVETGVDWPRIVELAKAQVPDEAPLNMGHEFRQPGNVNKPGEMAPELTSIKSTNWG